MEPTVRISSGRLSGVERDGVYAFLGVPYAADAVGRARFEAPRPAPSWDGVRDASRHGPTPLQAPYPSPLDQLLPSAVQDGPDYLNVSIWTPDPATSGLPVMVWLPGGAFVRGANSIGMYDGRAFARDAVVVVGVNYRLGLSGFPVLPDAPSNLGIRDQLLALAWVRENISAFGGDPDNVTLFGESAGGMSVATLMASPAARGLFSRAVVQSGSGSAVGEPDDLRRVTEAVASRLGVAATAAALSQVAPGALRAAQTDVLTELSTGPDPQRWGATTIRAGLGIMGFFPCIDGDVVPGLPVDGIAAGPAVPLLTGTTAEEFRLFTVPTGVAASITKENLPFVAARYGWPPALVDLYSRHRPGARPGDVATAILTDMAFRGPTAGLAEAAHTAGSPAHVYEFAWRTEHFGLGACHALEIPFVFDTLDRPDAGSLTGPNPPRDLATTMHAAWVAYAHDGDPGWPAYTPEARSVMTFDTASDVVTAPRAEELDWWLTPPSGSRA